MYKKKNLSEKKNFGKGATLYFLYKKALAEQQVSFAVYALQPPPKAPATPVTPFTDPPIPDNPWLVP